jgi:hypothetical protein
VVLSSELRRLRVARSIPPLLFRNRRSLDGHRAVVGPWFALSRARTGAPHLGDPGSVWGLVAPGPMTAMGRVGLLGGVWVGRIVQERGFAS